MSLIWERFDGCTVCCLLLVVLSIGFSVTEFRFRNTKTGFGFALGLETGHVSKVRGAESMQVVHVSKRFTRRHC